MSLRQLLAAIERAGYTPGGAKLRVAIRGMTCASCVSTIEAALKCTPGVVAADVNLSTESAKLPAGEEVILEFLPDKEGEYGFSCQMGMFRGKLIVE